MSYPVPIAATKWAQSLAHCLCSRRMRKRCGQCGGARSARRRRKDTTRYRHAPARRSLRSQGRRDRGYRFVGIDRTRGLREDAHCDGGRAQQLATKVATTCEEASTNVQAVASATEELASSVSEITRQVQKSARMASEAVDHVRDQRTCQRIVQGRLPHRRRGRADPHHRRPDQPAGAQRDHRSGARRRSGRGFAVVASKSRRWPSRPRRPPTKSPSRSPASRLQRRSRSARSGRSAAPSSGCRRYRLRLRRPWKSKAPPHRKSPATSSRPPMARSACRPISATSSAAPPRPARPPRRCSRRLSRWPCLGALQTSGRPR